MNRINSLAENEDSVVLDASGRPARHDGAHRGRRLSWREFYALRPDLRPDNDNGGAASEVDDPFGTDRCLIQNVRSRG